MLLLFSLLLLAFQLAKIKSRYLNRSLQTLNWILRLHSLCWPWLLNWLMIHIVWFFNKINVKRWLHSLLLYHLFSILWTWHQSVLAWDGSASREDWANDLSIKTCSLIKSLMILVSSTRGPIIFVLHSLITLASLLSCVDILTLINALNLADVYFLHSLNLVELILVLNLTIDITRGFVNPHWLSHQSGISEPLIVPKVDLDDTCSWV